MLTICEWIYQFKSNSCKRHGSTTYLFLQFM